MFYTCYTLLLLFTLPEKFIKSTTSDTKEVNIQRKIKLQGGLELLRAFNLLPKCFLAKINYSFRN